MRVQSSAERSSNGTLPKIPALLTTASRRPNASTAASMIAWPPAGLSTESYEAIARAARLLDLVDHVVGDLGVGAVTVHRAAEVVDHHRGAAARQVQRVEPTESAAGAGDDGHLAGEVNHACCS